MRGGGSSWGRGSTDPGYRSQWNRGTPPSPQDVTSTIGDILGLNAKATQYQADSAASTIEAEGSAAEAEAYRISGGIAEQNAELERRSANLEALQQERLIHKTIGGQRAAVAASGFGEAGTAVDLMRDTIRQGALSTALTRMQGDITAGGYLAQAAASAGASLAATKTSQAATLLAQQYATAGALATTNSANLMSKLLSTTGAGSLDDLTNYTSPRIRTPFEGVYSGTLENRPVEVEPLYDAQGNVNPKYGRRAF